MTSRDPQRAASGRQYVMPDPVGDRAGAAPVVVFGPDPVGVTEIVALARGRATAALADDPAWRARIEWARHRLEERLVRGDGTCGITTAMPAAAFSRSTESHNQDKVSMGTIAARDALRIVELSEGLAAILALAACQAVDLRGPARFSERAARLHARVRAAVPPLVEDRPQDVDIAQVQALHRSGALVASARGAAHG